VSTNSDFVCKQTNNSNFTNVKYLAKAGVECCGLWQTKASQNPLLRLETPIRQKCALHSKSVAEYTENIKSVKVCISSTQILTLHLGRVLEFKMLEN